ncbi:MAG: COX15/CtaA family protein [Proteobacteria bacterium]|nr:COX15/CtaA family protein [Pseudomonadota bacterium]
MDTQAKSLERGLWVTFFMIFIMIILGGVTRLTGSGLSIVEWKPITGILPPLSAQDWDTLFAQYQTSPEFQKINSDMTLEGFKGIFWLEYVHRLWGRLIGLVFLWPIIVCARDHELRREFLDKLLIILGLGGAQGFLGWIMVKSGLTSEPHVDHLRLAFHFMLGVATFAFVLWTALSVKLHKGDIEKDLVNRDFLLVICVLVTLTLFYGALVAGLKAGLIYNTFPMMGETWIPLEFFNPYFNVGYFLNDPGVVQFTHRCLAMLSCVSVLILLGQSSQFSTILRPLVFGLFIAILFQAGLGILTVLTHVSIPLASLHQTVAMIVIAILTSLLALTEQER